MPPRPRPLPGTTIPAPLELCPLHKRGCSPAHRPVRRHHEPLALAPRDVGGGEHGHREHRLDHVEQPTEDPEEEADEGQCRQHEGQDGARDQHEAEDGGDEAVGDPPHGLEGIEALAEEGDGFEQPGADGDAGDGADRTERRGDQVMAEAREIGDGVAAVGDDHGIEIDELEEA